MNERAQASWVEVSNRLTTAGLEALRLALIRDDPRLIQGQTVTAEQGVVTGACAIGYAGWQGEKRDSCVGVLHYFRDNIRTGEGLGSWFLHWYDKTPRDEMRRKLLPEVEKELIRRHANAVNAHFNVESQEPAGVGSVASCA